MSLLLMRRWMLDRLVFEPSRQPIEVDEAVKHELAVGRSTAELWCHEVVGKAAEVGQKPIVILKFPGTSGRAEHAGTQPLSLWPHRSGIVVTVNPPGYGATRGRARLTDAGLLGAAIHEWLLAWSRTQAIEPTLIVSGNSLGAIRALDYVSRFPAAGVLLRNPPYLSRMIEVDTQRKRIGWIGRWLNRALPREWEVGELAGAVGIPVFAVQSAVDRRVPVQLQDELLSKITGPLRVLRVTGADHETPVPESLWPDLQAGYDWLLCESESQSK